MTLSDEDKAKAVEGLKRSVKLLVQLQWDLNEVGTLDEVTREGLTIITEYHMSALLLVDPDVLKELSKDLAEIRDQAVKNLTAQEL